MAGHMRIAIIGTGATGSVYAALLADAGHQVWAVDRWQEHIEAIRARGLRLSGASGERVVALGATTKPVEVGPVDLVVIATKARDVESAARAALPLLGAQTVVLPIQNGLGSRERVAAIVGGERVLTGVIGGFGASIVSPGHAHHHGMELVRFGEGPGRAPADAERVPRRPGRVTDRVEAIADAWRRAGFKVRTYADVDSLVWEKLICNVAFSATCALTGATIGAVIDHPAAWSVATACAAEAYAVARARGIDVGFEDPVSYVREFGRAIPGARPSMLLDVLAGRPTEIEVINGAIPPLADELNIDAPVNRTVSALVSSLEHAGTAPVARRSA